MLTGVVETCFPHILSFCLWLLTSPLTADSHLLFKSIKYRRKLQGLTSLSGLINHTACAKLLVNQFAHLFAGDIKFARFYAREPLINEALWVHIFHPLLICSVLSCWFTFFRTFVMVYFKFSFVLLCVMAGCFPCSKASEERGLWSGDCWPESLSVWDVLTLCPLFVSLRVRLMSGLSTGPNIVANVVTLIANLFLVDPSVSCCALTSYLVSCQQHSSWGRARSVWNSRSFWWRLKKRRDGQGLKREKETEEKVTKRRKVLTGHKFSQWNSFVQVLGVKVFSTVLVLIFNETVQRNPGSDFVCDAEENMFSPADTDDLTT